MDILRSTQKIFHLNLTLLSNVKLKWKYFSCFVCFLECPNFNMTRNGYFKLYDTKIANINWALSSSITEVTLTCLFCHIFQGRRNRGPWVTIDSQYFGRSSSINLFHQNVFYFFVSPPPHTHTVRQGCLFQVKYFAAL